MEQVWEDADSGLPEAGDNGDLMRRSLALRLLVTAGVEWDMLGSSSGGEGACSNGEDSTAIGWSLELMSGLTSACSSSLVLCDGDLTMRLLFLLLSPAWSRVRVLTLALDNNEWSRGW